MNDTRSNGEVTGYASVPRNGNGRAHDAGSVVWHEIVTAVRRRVWLVLAPAVVLTIGAAVLVWRETPQYRARAVLRVGDARRSLTSGLEVAVEPDRLMDPLLSLTQLLKSQALVGSVVDSLGLRLDLDDSQVPPSLLDSVFIAADAAADTLSLEFSPTGVTAHGTSAPAGAAGAATYGQVVSLQGGAIRFQVSARPKVAKAVWIIHPRDETIDDVLERLRAVPRLQTNIVDVTYSAANPALATQVVNLASRTFQRMDARNAQEQSRRRGLFLDEQLKRADAMLARAQVALSAFRSRQQVYSSREKLTGQQSDIALLSTRRRDLETERDAYQALLNQMESPTPAEHQRALRALVTAPGAAGNPVLTQLQTQLLRYRASFDSLTSGAWGSSSTNPDVQRLRDLVRSTEEQIRGAMRSRLASLDAEIAAVGTQASRSAAAIRGLPAIEAEEVRLVQDVDNARRLGDQVAEERQRAHMAEAVEVGQVEIVDKASVPYQPGPRYGALKLALALMLGLGLGAAAAVGLERLDPSIHRPDELEQGLQIPSLAVIPKVNPAQLEGTEAYRVLRTNLLLAPSAQTSRSVIVTSSVPGEGKTTTAANLAASLAWEGRRVLLVDGDLWRGRLHRLFATRKSPGFAESLMHDEPIPEAIYRTQIERLSFMPNGKPHGAPSDVVTGARVPPLLARLQQQFDVIVIDTPPVLAAAETAVLACSVDGVMLVVRAGRTDREQIQLAMRQLTSVNARLVGAVLNDPANIAGRYGYHQYYGAYYADYARAGS